MKTPKEILIEVYGQDFGQMDANLFNQDICIRAMEMYKNQPKKSVIKKPKLVLVSFQLTMPNRGSWNGQWSGQNNLYYIIRKTRATIFTAGQTEENFHYSWSDGWSANVSCEIVDSKEAAKRRKISKGFCGYEWMVDSIIDYGTIADTAKRKDLVLI